MFLFQVRTIVSTPWRHPQLKSFNSVGRVERPLRPLLNTKLYQQYVDKLKSSIKNDPSAFWSLVKSKRSIDCFPKLLHYDTRSSIVENDQADMFAEFFNESFNATAANQNWSPTAATTTESILLDEYFVFDQLMNIKTLLRETYIQKRRHIKCKKNY